MNEVSTLLLPLVRASNCERRESGWLGWGGGNRES
jgi:hypothetical protein